MKRARPYGDAGDAPKPSAGHWRRVCGGRYGVVPADVLMDTELSQGARLLFAILCTHANADHELRRSLARLAKELDVTKRTIQKWMRELELARLVVRLNEDGKMGVYRVNRDRNAPVVEPGQMAKLAARTARYAEYGKRGAEAKKQGRSPNGPVNEISPPREANFARTGVNEISPEHDTSLNKPCRNKLPASNERDGALASPPEGGSLASADTHSERMPEPSIDGGAVARQDNGVDQCRLRAFSPNAQRTAKKDAYRVLAEKVGWVTLVTMDQAEIDRFIAEQESRGKRS